MLLLEYPRTANVIMLERNVRGIPRKLRIDERKRRQEMGNDIVADALTGVVDTNEWNNAIGGVMSYMEGEWKNAHR